ncbi:hypothetical protein TNIN_303081 [Trichonephila inaurata madagascariensis]|uniref:Uncharacterized protein n=1 Tax=Trichonephila inaurata madagascariensis TaxID=2747483 RepID=A0A8X7CIQ7_9ARAC|nr:hypothetical protein TNIN_303081 [Trichonephila inaurata madagascariensis]
MDLWIFISIFENGPRMLLVQHRPTKKILRNVYPHHVGISNDLVIRHQQVCTFERIFLPFLILLFKWILAVFLYHLWIFAIYRISLPMIRPTRTWYRKKWFVCLPTMLWIGVKELSYYVADCPPKTGRHDCGGERWFLNLSNKVDFFLIIVLTGQMLLLYGPSVSTESI